VLGLVGLLQNLAGRRLVGDGALQGELRCLVVVLLDLLVVARFPVDEDADADEEVVRFLERMCRP